MAVGIGVAPVHRKGVAGQGLAFYLFGENEFFFKNAPSHFFKNFK